MTNLCKYSKLSLLQFYGLLLILSWPGSSNIHLRAIGSVGASDYDSDSDSTNQTRTRTKETTTTTTTTTNNTTTANNNNTIRPTIYTYFERIDVSNRTTGMTDEDDSYLLQFWKERWISAGYTPIVLTAVDVEGFQQKLDHQQRRAAEYESSSSSSSIQSRLDALNLDDFSRILFRRWIAMAAVGGGWFTDYDNFPLRDFSHQEEKGILHQELPNNGKMTVHDLLSPTLASGSGKEWLDTLDALLDDAKEHCQRRSTSTSTSRITDHYYYNCFYTDSLGIHSLRTNNHKMAPRTTRQVAAPFDKNDPVSFDDPKLCSSKQFRTKWTVHFGPEILQRGKHIPRPADRLPKYRFKLARDWLDRWQVLCLQ